MTPQDEQRLERLIHQTLRDLPPRPAPRSLEQRVRAAIAEQAALPWWKRSFAYWPAAARVAFVLVSVGVLAGIYRLEGTAPAFDRMSLSQIGWVHTLMAFVGTARDFSQAVIRSIPPLWLYGGMAFVAMLYVALFGLGAAVYRTLHVTR